MHQMMIEISEDTYQEASTIAARTGKTVETILAMWLNHKPDEIPVEFLKAEQVLKLADRMLSEEQQAELDELLGKNSEGQLDEDEKLRLDVLMDIHNQVLLRKSEAIAIAVERGLRPPLSNN